MKNVEEIFELSEEEKGCKKCGGIAEIMKGTFEESEVIDEVQRTFRVIKAKRQKAVHQCDCSEKKIVVAKGPEKAISRGRFSLNFAISIVISKYCYHIPLEAQSTQMKDQGLLVKPNVLWNQIEHKVNSAFGWKRGCPGVPSQKMGSDLRGASLQGIGVALCEYGRYRLANVRVRP